jgi:hypothetical protein
MNGVHVEAMTRELPWNAAINRKTALKVVGGCFALLASAPRLRPIAVKADHDGT